MMKAMDDDQNLVVRDGNEQTNENDDEDDGLFDIEHVYPRHFIRIEFSW